MITKERLEELIKQGATIYYIYSKKVIEKKRLKHKHHNFIVDDKELYEYNEELGCGVWARKLKGLFENKAEAEWHAEFGSIERTERLEFPTWEELQDEVGNGWKRLFIGFDEEKEPMQFMLGVIPDDKIYIGFTKEIGAKVFDIEFEALTTKENYTLACRKCKELFLGESE